MAALISGETPPQTYHNIKNGKNQQLEKLIYSYFTVY
jgi:hypothetical protein